MFAPTFTREEIEYFAQSERPGVQIAKDLYALAIENFASMDTNGHGCITAKEISEFAGNQRLKDFLNAHGQRLSCLSFTAKNLVDLLKDSGNRIQGSCCKISFSDLNTFSWLCEDINRRNFYDGNFQSLREGAGLNAAGWAFLEGIVAGLAMLVIEFSKLKLFLSPAEAIAFGIIATVGVPLCSAMIGYFFGTRQADRYFQMRIEKIDQILEHLEQTA